MANPMKVIHNVETGEIIEREMNADELAQWQADQAALAAQEQEAIKTAEAKAALLEKLGITADEAKLLLS
jgi:hypothetical protein